MLVGLRRKRSAAAVGVATLFLAGGAPSPASAATTYWTFSNPSNHKCLTASADPSSTAVFTQDCLTLWAPQDWDWIGPPTQGGQNMLRSRSRNLCLTTDNKTNRNAVWLAPCVSQTGQGWGYHVFWYTDQYGTPWESHTLWADVGFIGTNPNLLRISPTSSAVYTSDQVDDESIGIPTIAHAWENTPY